ncbi:MAG: type II toxin-antitoxin system VapC family toxin [Solirubrobacteraceae bacterium]
MRLLLDTRVFLWLQTEPQRLGHQLQLVEDPLNELLLSAASAWEIVIKHSLGRLPLPEAPARYVPRRVAAIGARSVPIEQEHALSVGSLPPLHRDPFDRLLVAHGTSLHATILTADAVVAGYDVPTIVIGG